MERKASVSAKSDARMTDLANSPRPWLEEGIEPVDDDQHTAPGGSSHFLKIYQYILGNGS